MAEFEQQPAATSRDALAQLPADVPPARAVRVLALDTHWFSQAGGISTLNRNLCAALARAGADVYCLVLNARPDEREDAAAAGVILITAQAVSGGSERDPLMRRPSLPSGVVPDVILGHGRITGPAAKVQVEDHFPGAAYLHVVHTSPDETEWRKPGRDVDAGKEAETRLATELRLGRDASRVLAIGPWLYELFARELSVFPGTPEPVRLDPGFDAPDADVRTPPRGPKQVLVLGRLDDYEIKGLDIAARATARACELLGADESEIDILLRGAPDEQHKKLRDAVRGWTGLPSLRVSVRSYTTDSELLRQDLRRATLVVMPSRAEGFGLVGLEAIIAGTPVLVSGRSGLGKLLRELLPADEARRLVVAVDDEEERDTSRWGHAIASVLRDPAGAFANAMALRGRMSRERTWAMAADRVLNTVPSGRTFKPATFAEETRRGKGQQPEPTASSRRAPATPTAPAGGRDYPGRVKIQFCQRLGDTWQELADFVGIAPHEQARFTPGDQARDIWHWLANRNRLPDLCPALLELHRPDLAALLDGTGSSQISS